MDFFLKKKNCTITSQTPIQSTTIPNHKLIIRIHIK